MKPPGHRLALFCSRRCPGKIILSTYQLARQIRDAGVTIIGGFHSPMEQECLRLLLRGSQPVIVCPARSIEGMRIPTEWRGPLADGRLRLLSPFRADQRRQTAHLAEQRNAFVTEQSTALFIAYAAPGGKIEELARQALATGKRVLTFEAPETGSLVELGAQPISPDFDWRAWAGQIPSPSPVPLFAGAESSTLAVR